jgi:hypothetical protein
MSAVNLARRQLLRCMTSSGGACYRWASAIAVASTPSRMRSAGPAFPKSSHIDPLQAPGALRGINGPIGAIVDLTVEPVIADASV